MYSEQLIQVYPNTTASKGYNLSFYRPGELSSSQYLLLNSSFSNDRPFIVAKELTISEIYCMTSSTNFPWEIDIIINNISVQTFTISSNAQIIKPNLVLAIEDTLSIAAQPNTTITDVLVNITLDYE
jgi:hypothetical protein